MLLVADYNETKELLHSSTLYEWYQCQTLVDSGYHSFQCSDISFAVRVGSCITTTERMHT